MRGCIEILTKKDNLIYAKMHSSNLTQLPLKDTKRYIGALHTMNATKKIFVTGFSGRE